MASSWLMTVCLAYLLYVSQLATAVNETVANANKGTWPGRKLTQLQPESLVGAGQALLKNNLCLYGVVTAFGYAVSQDGPNACTLVIADFDAYIASQCAFFTSGSIKRWSLHTGAPAGVLVFPAPNATSWLDRFFSPDGAGCPNEAAAVQSCLSSSIPSAVAYLQENPAATPTRESFIGNCNNPPLQVTQCVNDAMSRTAATLQTPRDTQQDVHAPYGPEGMHLDNDRKMLYVADVTGSPDVAGSVKAFHWTTQGVGEWAFDFTVPQRLSRKINGPFWPRAIAARLDEPDFIYVTARSFLDQISGWVFKYNVVTRRMQQIFIEQNRPELPMYRPDGIVWGPDNTWYVATFRADANDTDHIMAFTPDGKWLPKKTINFNPGGTFTNADLRVYTQHLAINNNNIYISVQNGTFEGQIRAYPIPVDNPLNPSYTVFYDGSAGVGSVWPMVWGPCPMNSCMN